MISDVCGFTIDQLTHFHLLPSSKAYDEGARGKKILVYLDLEDLGLCFSEAD